tara:strand:- start:5798 stop:7642 length:1845 start_codon:yes stop_codon:yes gene_type:complete
MASDIKKDIKKELQRSYLAKDFNSFRAELLTHARVYFPDRIRDFTEASLGGLLLDMAAFVGDSMAFYLDHQFNELNWATAIESKNVQKHLRNAGVKVRGAAPSVCEITFYFEIPAELVGSEYEPSPTLLPKVSQGTRLASAKGVPFSLVEDLDFTEKDYLENYLYDAVLVEADDSGNPVSYVVTRTGICLSGEEKTESIKIPNVHKPYRTLTLSSENITEIISVKDVEENAYYEVNNLTQDTVFEVVTNTTEDADQVPNNIEIIPAPYRFTTTYDYNTKLTKLRFGAGDATTLDNDIVPDPAELALPLYGKKTFGRFTIDPNSLLQTHTLGIAPKNTTLKITYRHGGGLNHNVAALTVKTVDLLILTFDSRAPASGAASVRASIDVLNNDPASGADNAPTLEELRTQIPASRQAQNRIITKEDLISRIYTLPNKFGRVYRVGVRPNPINSLASQIFVISRDKDKKLGLTPDTLKKNLRKYLNEFRAVSDAFDILDAQVVNFAVNLEIVAHPSSNKTQVAQTCIKALTKILDTKNFQIDMPIALSDITNVVLNTQGVISLVDLKITNVTGTIEERVYSDVSFNVDANTFQQMVIGPDGSIFELKYPDTDIKISVR